MTDSTNDDEQHLGGEAQMDAVEDIPHSKSIEDLHAELLEAAENDQAKVPDLVQRIKKIAPDNSVAPTNENSSTPLHLILQKDVDENTLSVLLSNMEPSEVNLFDESGDTAVHVAAQRGRVLDIKALIDAGADPFIQNKSSQRTALHIACEDGRHEIVTILRNHAMEKGKSLDIQDEDGMTPLHIVCQHGQNEILATLLPDIESRNRSGGPSVSKPNIDIDKQDNDGWTALMYAAAYNNYEIFRTLLENDADVNKKTTAGDTILMKAADWGEESTVTSLYEYYADIHLQDGDGWTALIYAAKSGSDDVVRALLGKNADINHRTISGENALTIAMEWNNRSTVKLLLENIADTTILNDGTNLLFWASKGGFDDIVEFLLEKLPLDLKLAIDGEGNTALHMASGSESDEDFSDDTNTRYHYEKTMIHLLDVPGIVNMQTIVGDTALHLATRANKPSRVGILLNKMSPEGINQKDEFGKTAFEIAVENGYREIVLELLQAFQPEPDTIEEALTWAIESESNHDIAKVLIKRRLSNPAKLSGIDKKWDVLELAVYCEDLPAVWQLLQVIAPADRNREKINRAKTLVDEMIQKGGKNRQKPNTRLDRGIGEKATDPTLRYDIIKKLLDDIDDYLGISTYVARLQRPISNDQTDDQSVYHPDVTITDFYTVNGLPTSRREKTSVKEVIYGPGPERIMSQKAERRWKIKNEIEAIKRYHRNPKIEKRRTDETSPGSTEEFQFRWIHLPANNMRWMEDLTMKVFYERAQHESTRYEIPDDEKGAHHREFGQVNSFMKRSWVEVPDKTSPSRFMKPQCTKSNVEQTIVLPNPVRPSAEPTTESNQTSGANISEDPNQKFKHVALYMPYLTFGIQKSKSDRKKIEGHDIIHHSRTLDEFYYQFIQSNNHSQEQVNKRNKDQVITKWLYGGKPQKLKNWIVLKVDQLWLWIITSDTIITSSTNREDGRDDVIYREVFDNLKSAAQQPGSTMALAELIVKTCIHTYDRVPLVKGENETVAAENRETYPLLAANHPSLTIHEIFSNAINDSVLVESKLFQSLIFNRENGLENKYDRSSKKTAELLYQDKDLRDELHILRAVVLHQKGVLEELCAGSSTMPKTAAQILFDIEEMEKHAEKLHDTAYSILTIQQSNIAIEDSKESLNQSRAMMVFTIATVFFLPLSFLSSLFALNVSSFQHNDQGELFYSPKWIFPMIFGISFIVAVPLIFYAFHHIIPEYWNISLPMSLNGKKGNCEGDDWKSDDDEESKFGKSPDDSKYSSGACQSFSKDTTMSAFRRSTHKKLQSTSPV